VETHANSACIIDDDEPEDVDCIDCEGIDNSDVIISCDFNNRYHKVLDTLDTVSQIDGVSCNSYDVINAFDDVIHKRDYVLGTNKKIDADAETDTGSQFDDVFTNSDQELYMHRDDVIIDNGRFLGSDVSKWEKCRSCHRVDSAFYSSRGSISLSPSVRCDSESSSSQTSGDNHSISELTPHNSPGGVSFIDNHAYCGRCLAQNHKHFYYTVQSGDMATVDSGANTYDDGAVTMTTRL
jgi:hypothetical protein